LPGQDMVFIDGKTYYRSTTAFINHLREIVTEENARTIRQRLSNHLDGEAREW